MLGIDGAVLARGSETDGSFELVVGSFPPGSRCRLTATRGPSSTS
jgi:hypothetical protein